MKKYYEAPEAKAMVFVSKQNLAFTLDDLQNVLQEPREAGDATIVSKTDIFLPLG